MTVNSSPHFLRSRATPTRRAFFTAAARRRPQPPTLPPPDSSCLVHTTSACESSRWPADFRCSPPVPLLSNCAVSHFPSRPFCLVCGRCFGTFPAPCGRKLGFRLRRPSGLRSLQKNRAKQARFFRLPRKTRRRERGPLASGRPADAGQKGTENVFQQHNFDWVSRVGRRPM